LLLPLIILGSTLAEQVTQASGWIRSLFSDGFPGPPPWIAEIPVIGKQVYEYWLGLSQNTSALLSELGGAKLLSGLGQYLLPAGEWLLRGGAHPGERNAP